MIEVHPSAIIDKSVKLSDGVRIGPNCVVEANSSIGENTILHANVYVGSKVQIGTGNELFPFCSIGCRPQVLGSKSDVQTGNIVIGNNNVIRENVTIHPSMYPDESTKIGNNNLIMIGVHIGHDCVLEDMLVISNYVQISGHCLIKTGVWLSGMVAIHQFITIGRWCYAAGLAGINHDVPPFMIISGHYPPQVRGVNKRGLSRAGMNEEQQKIILQTYKQLYRENPDIPLLEKAKTIANDNGIDENAKEIVDSIINSSKQRFGRYLELFRH